MIQPTSQDGDGCGGGNAPGDGEATDADPLHAGMLDRPDAPDLDDDPRTRPAADIIADICRDLGLAALPGAHPWTGRTPEDIGQLCARAATSSQARPAPVRRRVAPPHSPPRPAPRQTATREPAPSHPVPPASRACGPAPPIPAATPRTTRPRLPPRSRANTPKPAATGARRSAPKQPPNARRTDNEAGPHAPPPPATAGAAGRPCLLNPCKHQSRRTHPKTPPPHQQF